MQQGFVDACKEAGGDVELALADLLVPRSCDQEARSAVVAGHDLGEFFERLGIDVKFGDDHDGRPGVEGVGDVGDGGLVAAWADREVRGARGVGEVREVAIGVDRGRGEARQEDLLELGFELEVDDDLQLPVPEGDGLVAAGVRQLAVCRLVDRGGAGDEWLVGEGGPHHFRDRDHVAGGEEHFFVVTVAPAGDERVGVGVVEAPEAAVEFVEVLAVVGAGHEPLNLVVAEQSGVGAAQSVVGVLDCCGPGRGSGLGQQWRVDDGGRGALGFPVGDAQQGGVPDAPLGSEVGGERHAGNAR
ncbi:hypothetical protein [Conexibacter sp. W3-3-2]|uniref:hypothetical protein n=1 Tax=Conexibacter sp. W3-3-2 TaxID=2675227 RepID=UPI0018AB5C5A|nr:hypothetical protein [Conexibacter sp. W3-3-2]